MKRHIVVPLIMIFMLSACGNTTTRIDTNKSLTPVATGQVAASQSFEGVVVPRQIAVLNFPTTSAVVAELMVNKGDRVEMRQPLARLDTRALELNVEQARASVAQAKAQDSKLRAPASAATLAAAEAQVAQAQAQLQQVQGSVTRQDIAAAQAQLTQAHAALALLQAGPKGPDLQSAQAGVSQAQANLQSQRDSLSMAKTNAAASRDQAANNLTQVQSRYATAKQNWDYVQATGEDPINPKTTDTQTGAQRSNKVNDAQRQQYYDAYVQAEAALRTAEQAVAVAVAAYDTARQQEVNGIAAAEAQLSQSQASLTRTQSGADKDQLAAARAQVAVAQANLTRLQGSQRAGAIDAATAAVALAQANLEKIQEPVTQADLDLSQAAISQAEVGLHAAELALQQASLRAPFSGTIAEINLRVGEVPNAMNTIASQVPNATSGAIVLADTSKWQIETTDLTELNIARVSEGSKVKLSFDAIPGLELSGTVVRIKPIGTDRKGDMTYTAIITPDTQDQRLRWNMTAVISSQ